MTTEHVLVVGTGREFPARFREAGAETSVIVRVESLHKVREPALNRRVIGVRADAPDEEWVALAAAAHAVHPFTRIATVGEREQDRCAAIGAALGLYTHSVETVALVHDKLRMREKLADLDIDSTAFVFADAESDVLAFFRANGPCVVKPIEGAGSAGVALVRAVEDVPAAWVRASGSHEGIPAAGVIVEQFHDGNQYSVEGFAEAGEHVTVSVTRKYSDPSTFVELGHVAPAPLTAAKRSAIEEYTNRVLAALGVEFGPTHTEIVLGADGPRLIETHVRFGGDDIPSLTLDVTGVDLSDCVVRQTLGEKVLPSIRSSSGQGSSAIWFAALAGSGVLADVSGQDEALAVDGVTSVQLLAKPGAVLDGLASSESRVAQVRAVADSPSAAIEAAREGVRRLGFLVRAKAHDGATV